MILNDAIKGPLIGVDISHHNMPFSRLFGDFQIHKATEGKTFVDLDYKNWATERPNGTLNGAYHFLSISSDVESQVDNFLYTVQCAELPVVLILDLEGEALREAVKDDSNAYKWLQTVLRKTGKVPWLYTNTYGTNVLSERLLNGFPLWIASYNKKYPVMDKKVKNDWTCWQYTNVPWDMDIFNGTPCDWGMSTWDLKRRDLVDFDEFD